MVEAVPFPPSATKPLLIFDFDGTLAQTLETGINIFNDIAPEYGLNPVTMEEAHELRKLHTRALLDRLGVSRLMAVKLAAHIRKLLHERMDEVKLIPNVSDAIRELKEEEFRMGILSSNSAENVRMFLQRYHLDDCFSFIEAGVSLFGKPRRIRNLLRKVKVPSSETVYIGDETRDMEASRKAQVCGIAVCWGANGREALLPEGPEFCVDTPAEMVAAARHFAEHGPPAPIHPID